MKPAPFAYHAPESVEEAVALLARGDGARVLAGGQSLVPLMKFRLSKPRRDRRRQRRRRARPHRGARTSSCVVGAVVRQQTLLEDADGRARPSAPARGGVATWATATRHRGTVGGSLAYAAPWAELTAARRRARRDDRGPLGARRAHGPAREFFRGAARNRARARRAADGACACRPSPSGPASASTRSAPATATTPRSGAARWSRSTRRGAARPPSSCCCALRPRRTGSTSRPRRRDAAGRRGARRRDRGLTGWPRAARRRRGVAAATAAASPATLARRALRDAAERAAGGRRRDGRAPSASRSRRGQRHASARRASSRGCTLADFLREELDLTGTHLACEHGFCGNCNVLLDGADACARACSSPCRSTAARCARSRASPSRDGTPRPLQQAFHDHHGLQCGFCTPAMLLTAHEFLRDNPGGRTTTRSARRSAASPAAAPATSRSSSPSAPRRRGRAARRVTARMTEHRAGPDRRPHRAGDGRHGARPALARQEPEPRRGSALPARPGPLRRRHQAAGMPHAAIVRSPHAHARIVCIDTSAAERLPGVDRACSRARTSRSGPRRCRRSAPGRSSRT